MLELNKVMIVGNLTRDPEKKTLQSGTDVCQFDVAINRRWTQNGEKKESVCFLNCKAWAKTAEFVAQYFKKGGRIYVEGRLEQETWTEKETNAKRSKHVLVAERVGFADSKKAESDDANADGESQPEETRGTGTKPRTAAQQEEDAAADLPF